MILAADHISLGGLRPLREGPFIRAAHTLFQQGYKPLKTKCPAEKWAGGFVVLYRLPIEEVHRT